MSRKKRTYVVFNDDDKSALVEKIRSKPVERPWQVDVSFYKNTRTLRQNNTYWLWIQTIIDFLADSTGEQKTKREIDAWLLDMFAPMESFEIPNGKVIARQKSTSEMNTKEMAEYLDKIDVYFASNFDLLLPKTYGQY